MGERDVFSDQVHQRLILRWLIGRSRLQSSIESIIAGPAICSKSAAIYRLGVVEPIRAGAIRADWGVRRVGVVSLDLLQTPFEAAGLDRPHKGVDQPRGAGGITPAP